MIASIFIWERSSKVGRLMFGQQVKVLFLAAISLVISTWYLMPMPAALAELDSKRGTTTDDLLAIRDIKTMSVSPNGNYVAYQVVVADKDNNDFNVSWYVASTKSDVKPLMVADGSEVGDLRSSSGSPIGGIGFSEILWSPNGEWVYFTKKANNQVQLWRSHRSRYGQEQVTHSAADVEGPKFSADGMKLFFAVGRSRAEINEANLENARQGYLVQDPPVYSVEKGPYWPPCSDARERWDQETNLSRRCLLTIMALDIETGLERMATVDEVEAYYAEADTSVNAIVRRGMLKGQNRLMETMSNDGKRLAWFENEDPAIFQGYYPPMWVTVSDENQNVRCQVAACQSTRPQKIWWSRDGNEVIFMLRNGPRNTLSSLYGWTPGEDKVRSILSSDDMFFDCTIVENSLICGHETWTSPRKIVSVDLDGGEIKTIADMNPEFQDFSFTNIEKIIGEDAYGNKAHAHLVYPKGYQDGHRYPMIIVQYRSNGFLRGGTGDEQPIHVFAQNGFVVLSFDSSEGEYEDKTADPLDVQIKYLKYAMVDRGPATAIEYMVDLLVDRGIVDPDRIGIAGLSHGATTLDTAIINRNYGAASTAYSVMSPPNFDFSSDSFWGKSMNGAFGGTPFSPIGFETRAKNSVGVNASRINTPLLIQVADREYFITKQNYNALKDAGKSVEMYIYPDEYHVKWQPAHRYMVYTRNIDWFNFWLRDVEDAVPGKVEQYKRWHILKKQHQSNMQMLSAER